MLLRHYETINRCSLIFSQHSSHTHFHPYPGHESTSVLWCFLVSSPYKHWSQLIKNQRIWSPYLLNMSWKSLLPSPQLYVSPDIKICDLFQNTCWGLQIESTPLWLMGETRLFCFFSMLMCHVTGVCPAQVILLWKRTEILHSSRTRWRGCWARMAKCSNAPIWPPTTVAIKMMKNEGFYRISLHQR